MVVMTEHNDSVPPSPLPLDPAVAVTGSQTKHTPRHRDDVDALSQDA